jgi:hypothetical protein
MTTSKHFEQAYITLSTMTKITLTKKKGKGYLFTIECYMPSFEPQNVRKRHGTMLEHDKFTFHPQKDLVLSMQYLFVANLEPDQFTPLDVQRLKKLKKN